jgi:hypothetical protein
MNSKSPNDRKLSEHASPMTSRKTFAATAKIAGALAVGLGLAFAASLCSPAGETGTSGLHRWTHDGETMLVYGTGNSYYMTATRVVTTAAAVFILLGSAFAFLGRRLRGTATHP